MLLLIDRAAAENKDASLKEMFNKLCSVDCIPQKKNGFVSYTMSLCKTDQDTAEKLWSVIDTLHTKQKEEKQLRTSLLVEMWTDSWRIEENEDPKEGKEREVPEEAKNSKGNDEIASERR